MDLTDLPAAQPVSRILSQNRKEDPQNCKTAPWFGAVLPKDQVAAVTKARQAENQRPRAENPELIGTHAAMLAGYPMRRKTNLLGIAQNPAA
jgi:hypothetical protein